MGVHARALSRILAFSEVVNRCQLEDLGFRGGTYMWDNYREDLTNVRAHLDRALATLSWLEWFSNTMVFHGISSYSDHAPIIVHIVEEGPRCRQKRRPRRFEEKWATHPNCEAITQNAWRQVTPAASPMFVLCEKIKVCREELFKWSSETFGREDQ